MSRTEQQTFLAFAYAEVARREKENKVSTAKGYARAVHSFERFLLQQGIEDLHISQLTAGLLKQYETWLRQNNVTANSSSAYNRSLHAIYRKMTEEQPPAPDPFADIFRGVAETAKRAVSSNDIHLIATIDIQAALQEAWTKEGKKTNGKRFSNKVQKLTFVRDMFIFSFCSRGMNFIDMAFLHKSDVSNGTISYCRSKTKKCQCVKIEDEMQAIMDSHPSDSIYQFPILNPTDDANALYKAYNSAISSFNKGLAELGKLLNLQLTTYVSRHSWADIAFEQEGIYFVSEGLGHNSIKTTQVYINSINNNRLAAGNRNLIKKVLHPENDEES